MDAFVWLVLLWIASPLAIRRTECSKRDSILRLIPFIMTLQRSRKTHEMKRILLNESNCRMFKQNISSHSELFGWGIVIDLCTRNSIINHLFRHLFYLTLWKKFTKKCFQFDGTSGWKMNFPIYSIQLTVVISFVVSTQAEQTWHSSSSSMWYIASELVRSCLSTSSCPS